MDEEAFLRRIAEDPASAAGTGLVLADWLEERGDPRAELVRLCHDRRYQAALAPDQKDERIRELLASGVKPCVPTIVNSIAMRLALIPAGTFLMGSPESEKRRRTDEGPQHEVEITQPFYLGVYPVTQQQYRKVMGKNPSHFNRKNGGGPKHPVEQVSWYEAVEFCRRLSAQVKEASSRRTYRLPTEAEWEYACRGGASPSTPFFFGNSLSSAEANFDGSHPYGRAAKGPNLERTTPVGKYLANAFGLFDMDGNVCEWCQDWYRENYYSRSPRQDPQGPEQGSDRVYRGGSWGSYGLTCRSATRSATLQGLQSNLIGFRVVCVIANT